jgi:cell division protein FtsL
MGFAQTRSSKLTLSRPFGIRLTTGRIDIVKFMIISMLLITLFSIFHVWSRFRVVELNLQIGEASRQLKELEQEQKRLRLEAESLKTPERVETIAKQSLGMVIPKDQQVILVK